MTGDTKTNPCPSTAQGQLAYTSCLSDLDWRVPIPGHTNTRVAESIYMLPSNMNLNIRSGTVGFYIKILVSDSGFV